MPWFQHRVNNFHLFQEANEHKSIYGQLKNGKIMWLLGQFEVQSDSSQKCCEDCRLDLHLHENESKRLCKMISARFLTCLSLLIWPKAMKWLNKHMQQSIILASNSREIHIGNFGDILSAILRKPSNHPHLQLWFTPYIFR